MSAMTTALLHRGSRFGDLRLTGYVGSGGFSDVYEAFDKSGRRLAIKVLRLTGLDTEGQQQRIEREREALSRIGSRGVAKLLHSDLQCETPWIASEFVDGPTLQEIVEEGGPLGRDEGLSLIRRLAEILDELHQEGIAHRDLSPNNIIIGPDGPVIIDFGSARINLEGGATGSLLLAGTSGFVPPEGIRGEPVGKAGDTYSLGRIARYATNLSEVQLPLELRLCLSEDQALRPNAASLASSLSEFRLTITRSSPRNVLALKRKFGIWSVAGIGLIASALTFWGAFLFLDGSGPITTESILGKPLSGDGDGYLNGVFEISSIPSGLEVERLRPIDSVFKYRPGDIDALVLYSQSDDTQDGRSVDVFGELKASYFDYQFDNQMLKSEVPLQGAMLVFADQSIDQFESALLPDGCALTRAQTAMVLPDDRIVWAATTSKCGDELNRTYSAGIVFDVRDKIAFSWFIASSQTKTWQEIITGLSARDSFVYQGRLHDISFQRVTGLRDFASNLGASGDSTIDFGIGLIRLPPKQSIELVIGENSEPQISLYFLDPTIDGPFSSPVPAGRWWARRPGESLIVSNPFDKESILAMEVESIFDDNEINLELSTSSRFVDSLTLRSSLGPDFQGLVDGEYGASETPVVVPLRLFNSLPIQTDVMPFFVGDADLSATSELAGASFGASDLTFAARADETYDSFELSYYEAHNPHWLISYSPPFELIIGRETSDWVRVFEPDDCGHAVIWKKELPSSKLVIQGFLDCSIFDIYRYGTSSTVPQSNLVFRFVLLDNETDYGVISGSFAPSSRDELLRFRTWLGQLGEESAKIINFFQDS